jgi:hypothetical protein
MTLIFCSLIGLVAYNEFLPEYFFSPTFVPLFFVVAFVLVSIEEKIRTRFLTPIILGIFLVANLITLLSAKRSYPLSQKILAVDSVISLAANQPFAVDVQSDDPCQIYGFRYLFTYRGIEPVASYMDPYFLWLYEKRLQKAKPTKKFQLTVFPQSIDVKESNN